jgi:hypothetical protein
VQLVGPHRPSGQHQQHDLAGRPDLGPFSVRPGLVLRHEPDPGEPAPDRPAEQHRRREPGPGGEVGHRAERLGWHRPGTVEGAAHVQRVHDGVDEHGGPWHAGRLRTGRGGPPEVVEQDRRTAQRPAHRGVGDHPVRPSPGPDRVRRQLPGSGAGRPGQVGGDVLHPPAGAQRRRRPLLGRQGLEEVDQRGALGPDHVGEVGHASS